jgi:hypothetical protein
MTTKLTARSPEDLLAVVPVVLGFRPAESLVMLTFGSARSFHARVDLPGPDDDPFDSDELLATLLRPCRAHRVDHVAFVLYTDRAALAARLAAVLVPGFVADGMGVVDVLRVHAGTWCSVPVRAGARESTPVPFDDAGHPFAAHAVFEGRVTHASREHLRALVQPDPDLRARWEAALTAPVTPAADPEAAPATVARWVETETDPDDVGAVEVLRAIMRPAVRDAMLGAVSRGNPRAHLRVWSALLRGAPDPQVPDTAAVAAFCAWQAGDGALAWCALDRCLEIEPDHVLGTCLAGCLTQAVAPSAWQEVVEPAALPD